LEVILFLLASVKNEFTLLLAVQETLFGRVSEILEGASPQGDALSLLFKTVLSFLGIPPSLYTLTRAVPYAKSLEVFELSFKALEFSFRAITIPTLSHSAARVIDKLIRSSPTIALRLEEVAYAIHQLLSSPVEISDKVCVVEGLTFLVAQSIEKEAIPQHLAPVVSAFEGLDVGGCEAPLALEALKVCLAVGRTLYTTSPAKLDASVWNAGIGAEMAEWMRRTVAVFSRRFVEDFEVMEVFSLARTIY
jgi:hypothetical protein